MLPSPPPPVPRPRAPRLIRPIAEPATVPPPLTGDWSPADTRLDNLELFPVPTGIGPEDAGVDASDRVLSGTDDGRIWRWPADATAGTGPELLAQTGGRPLGIELDPRDGSLIVCDAYRGLLRLTNDGSITELATGLMFCNNAAVGRDGTVYFSDSSSRFPVSAWRREMLERGPNGRLLAWSPGAGTVEVIASGLYFPNGVALSPDESTVIVAETSTHRLLRVPLRSGSPEPMLDLPGYPDNLSSVGDGTYWVALPSIRLPIAERLLPHPGVRRFAALLPAALQPQPKRYGLVALVDGDGQVRRTLHGPQGSFHMITGVRQHDDFLWLGSLTERALARVRVAA